MPQLYRIGSYIIYFWANNNSKIPGKLLERLMDVIESNSDEIKEKWVAMFGEISFFC